ISPKDAADDSSLSPDGSLLLRLSPDGTRLLRLTKSRDEMWIRSFDTTTGQEQFAIPYQPDKIIPYRADRTSGPSYSPDGKSIVAAEQGGLRRWDAPTGAEDPRARGVAGHSVPLAGPDALPAVWTQLGFPLGYRLWDGKEIKVIKQPWEGPPGIHAISPDGT